VTEGVPVRFFSRKIAVTFIDSQTDEVFARTSAAADQLPESFLLHTTMQLLGEEWSVDSAEPPTRTQYAKTRKLVLRVSRVRRMTIDPRELLFSLPTIAGSLPEDDEPADGTEILLLEDDWRQLEFVHEKHLDTIAAEFADIQRLYAENRKGSGFTNCHSRERIAAPLPNDLVVLPFPNSAGQRLRLSGYDHRVRGGFAVRLSGGWLLYGSRDGARIETLGLFRGSGSLSPEHQTALAQFAAEHGLVLVDWCRHASVDPKTESLDAIIA
jgi:hypothetical protein